MSEKLLTVDAAPNGSAALRRKDTSCGDTANQPGARRSPSRCCSGCWPPAHGWRGCWSFTPSRSRPLTPRVRLRVLAPHREQHDGERPADEDRRQQEDPSHVPSPLSSRSIPPSEERCKRDVNPVANDGVHREHETDEGGDNAVLLAMCPQSRLRCVGCCAGDAPHRFPLASSLGSSGEERPSVAVPRAGSDSHRTAPLPRRSFAIRTPLFPRANDFGLPSASSLKEVLWSKRSRPCRTGCVLRVPLSPEEEVRGRSGLGISHGKSMGVQSAASIALDRERHENRARAVSCRQSMPPGAPDEELGAASEALASGCSDRRLRGWGRAGRPRGRNRSDGSCA